MSARNLDGDITLYDEFAGAGGSSQGAAAVPGVRPILAANHWQTAVDSHAANFPTVDHYVGDVAKADLTRFPRADIFWASPACFVAGTLILTRRGLVPIETITTDDVVLTHKLRWQRVSRTMARRAETVTIKGVGLSDGIQTTADHPFYSRQKNRVWDNSIRRYNYTLDEATWVEAADMVGQRWATPTRFGDVSDPPEVGGRPIEMDSDFWWMVGRWLGDGWARIEPRTTPQVTPRPRRLSQPLGSMCITCGDPARPAQQSRNGQLRKSKRSSLYCEKSLCRHKEGYRKQFSASLLTGVSVPQ